MEECPFVSFDQDLSHPLFFTVTLQGDLGGKIAKSNYSHKKRKKELARKLKQEQKRQRKLDKRKVNSDSDLDTSYDGIEKFPD